MKRLAAAALAGISIAVFLQPSQALGVPVELRVVTANLAFRGPEAVDDRQGSAVVVRRSKVMEAADLELVLGTMTSAPAICVTWPGPAATTAPFR